jgi:hypothetical protein
MKFWLAFVALTFLATSPSFSGEYFSCPFGKRAACLDYSDTVCDGVVGKCVDSSAKCFSSSTCGYEGFVCKSDLDDLQRRARSLATDYDTLVVKYNSLLDSGKTLASQLDALTAAQEEAKRCLTNATSLEEAQACRF